MTLFSTAFLLALAQDVGPKPGKEHEVLKQFEGEMFGGKFVGHGTMGYDTFKKKYTGTWFDSMATGHYTVEGSADEAGKVMEGADPQSGEPMKMKLVHELKGKDSRGMKFYAFGPDGKEIETGSIEYARKN